MEGKNSPYGVEEQHLPWASWIGLFMGSIMGQWPWCFGHNCTWPPYLHRKASTSMLQRLRWLILGWVPSIRDPLGWSGMHSKLVTMPSLHSTLVQRYYTKIKLCFNVAYDWNPWLLNGCLIYDFFLPRTVVKCLTKCMYFCKHIIYFACVPVKKQ